MVGTSAGNPGGPFAGVPDGTPIFGLVNYSAPVDAGGDVPQNTYFLVARADYNFTDKTQLFFRFARESLFGFPGSASGGSTPYSQYNVGQTIYNNNYLLSVAHTFRPNLLSTTELSFFRVITNQDYDTSLQNVPTLFLYNNASINGQPVNLPGFFPATTGTGGLPYGGPLNAIQVNEDLSWIKGKHSMKFGGQINYFQMNRGFAAYGQANEQLGKSAGAGLDNMMTGTLTNFTVAVNPAGKFPCSAGAYSGTTRGDLIVTPDCTVAPPLTAPDFTRSDRNTDWAVYAEDSWRVTPKFTFNYGVRYEHYGVQHNNNQQLDSNLYYGSGSSVFEQIHNGSIQLAPNSSIGGLWSPTWGTVGPRAGFAYDVFGNGKTALRGGYGITYERNFGNVTFNIIQNPPNNATVSVSNTPVSVSNLGPLAGSGGAGIPLPPVSPRNVADNIQTAQTQFWGLTLEHKLGSKSVVALEYNGAHGVHLYDIKNLNEIGGGQVYLGEPLVTSDPNNASCTTSSPCFTRPNQQFTSINNRGSSGFSHYNGLTVHFQTQELWRTGISILSNYTWSHALDNISSTFSESSTSSNGVGNLGYLDPRNPALDYGNSDFDIRNHFGFAAIWNEPFFKGSRGFLGQVAGGWAFDPIFTARSGTPFSISDTTSCLNCLTGPYGIPRYTPSSAISSFHTGAGADAGSPNTFNLLSLPAANSFTGLLGVSDFGPYPSTMTTRNQFYGPGAWSFDLAMSKTFPVTERLKLEFRAEAFNIFNHSNMYFNGFIADAGLSAPGSPIVIQGKKGGLGVLANDGQHDERRFGQFALRAEF
jgi:TonB dependent receptor-like, beta-barrel